MSSNQDELTLSSYTVACYIVGFQLACEVLQNQTGVPREEWSKFIGEMVHKRFKNATQEDVNTILQCAIIAGNEVK